MDSEQSDSSKQNGLLIRASTGLISLPEGDSPALSEIINRSLAHIQAGRALTIPEWRAGEEQEFEIAPGVKIVMCWIPPGEFLMGSPEDEVGRHDEEAQHRVTIAQGFWMGKYQVTQAQWDAVMGSNRSHFKGSNLPVESITWIDISKPQGFMERASRFTADGGIFSLPTEAQWEYACRAGTVAALNNGKNLTTTKGTCPNLDEVAWYGENGGYKTHPVGQKKANAWGLHDMHGNVQEWCLDWYEGEDETQADPMGPATGSGRVYRGGGWGSNAFNCRSAYRFDYPCISGNALGFRIARSSAPSCDRKYDDVEACVVADGKLHPIPELVQIVP